jgi:hypothetical protein
MKTGIKHRFQQGHFATIYEYVIDLFTVYYINRCADLSYELVCHMSGCGTDHITSGTLAQCYNRLIDNRR